MVKRQYLSPALFYLQDFNQYHVLAIPASEMGNLTLVGRNTAGKTTLANCFYPMLIDGSIATPSFNAAKGTEKLDQSTTVRNSKQDARTFEKMLLGFGSGAKKIRTGYACLLMKSDKRQVLFGIGAHRATDGTHGKTWWFVVIEPDPEAVISLITTDETGQSLEKAAFIDQNATLGDRLRVFSRADEYRTYVADAVYGFDNEELLRKLANTYRLLASPILTGGAARFQPILTALKEAQEPIDAAGIIYPVANSQRKLNQQQALLSQLNGAQKALHKIKNAIFWGNLNALNDRYLTTYSDLDNKIQATQTTLTSIEQTITALTEQLALTQTNVVKTQATIDDLRQQQFVQQTLQEKRKRLTERQNDLDRQLADYQRQQRQLSEQEQKLTELSQQKHDVEVAKQQLEQQLTPVVTTLNSRSAMFTQLGQALAEVDRQTQVTALKRYLETMKDALITYQQRQVTMQQLTHAIEVVNGMQHEMSGAIEQRLQGPFVARNREELQQDNQRIHQSGAGQMSQAYQQLLVAEKEQLMAQPDIKRYLADEAALKQVVQVVDQFATILHQLMDEQHHYDDLVHNEMSEQEHLASMQTMSDDSFDEQAILAERSDIAQELTTLVLDPTVDERLATAKQREQELQDQRSRYDQKLNQSKGQRATLQTNLQKDEANLKQQAATIETALRVLTPYCPEKTTLTSVDEVLTFEQTNRAAIRNHPISELGTTIRDAINGATRHPVRIEASALDTLFEQQGYSEIASAMRQQRTVTQADMMIVAFDINEALTLMAEDATRVTEAVSVAETGNEVALQTYTTAAVDSITTQYHAIDTYNQMLAEGQRADGIQLKVDLQPQLGLNRAINEALTADMDDRPALASLIATKISRFTDDEALADDDDAFMKSAREALDTRDWSVFKVLIHRRQSAPGEFEIVDDTFVQTGGSGAEKAQTMVLPLLLVPKMLLTQAHQEDAPHMVMFDEFADKLDADTAKVFAQTIFRFGFSFIATMPSGGQTKVLADGVENVAWEVLAPKNQNDGKFHLNRVRQALVWR